MEPTTIKTNFVFGKMLCKFFGHSYLQSKKVTDHVHEYTCTCCGKQATVDVKGRIVDLTPKRQDINNTLSEIYKKRRRAVAVSR